ncbi:hypothetical protein DKM44_12620 [Deinococcus irradiatisoli]|uniref:Beta-lactamase class A catalytic domain-containing protein n=1 Tax=Deinococcus irradiatisoli TaxID=2202254 RepID=A0A2Z3JIZ8_9DEIO|nr:serine hydrolase [Deinococcus irradiatisoli]AWN23966.1 hypothetical protein DKM44_12620 [Deinococcus irradiatisoli]
MARVQFAHRFAALGCALLIGVAAALRFAEHPGYTRLVFDVPGASGAVGQSTAQGLRIVVSGAAPPAEHRQLQTSTGPLTVDTAGQTIQVQAPGHPLKLLTLPAGDGQPFRVVVDVQSSAPAALTPQPLAQACPGVPDTSALPSVPVKLPAGVSGNISFMAAVIDPVTLRPLRVATLHPDALHPMASTFKQLVLWSVLLDVDAGRLKPDQVFEVTPQNRSLESYVPGKRTLLELAKASIQRSENTAADILMRATTPDRVQDLIDQVGTCNTSVLMPTKAYWSVQAGLLKDFNPADLLGVTAPLLTADEPTRRALARKAVAGSLKVDVAKLGPALDRFYKGSYDPRIDWQVENRTTPRELVDLIAHAYLHNGLSAAQNQRYWDLMGLGCCQPDSKAKYPYWGAKSGVDWGLLNLTGLVRTQDGQYVAYAYMNHQSSAHDVLALQAQKPLVTNWIATVVDQLTKAP